ncbi:N-methyl-L-tryptophan oxidase [Marinitenerispora sediminis]|uniref:N-methyl-L-tryptophan oxidase n=1 Tax=Marinitenerispora sediminis TaxID=1931232 RepID=A0A368T1B9_9ACTN|nr:N-methyl-L-tryptophan oxidase [Marinitenerispora sediminis]RCV48624.1 N-methyl-L-tryptophan oxidase [Marinitenerispora sediminis]RCV50394.1 N-methyl-L-tryptophan oxidase [Marinitenerispora sediminis]RCV53572.1 N-methyl-L-tryptophan oxidase [Marinitenerispora sediminis]
MNTSYDVVVIGLGGMGSAAAYHLAARGARVLGLERFGPAHDQGSSHGGSRIIRQAYFEDPAYVPLLLRAYELWERLERDSGADLLVRTGGLMIGRPDSRTVAGSRRSAEQWGLPHSMLDAAEIRRRFPTFTPEPDEVALHEERAGLVRPEATVAAHLRLAAAAGADLRFEEPAVEWDAPPGGGVRVTTPAGGYTAERLVVCPGAWAPRLLADLGVPLTVERQVQHWFAPRGGIGPFLPERHPIYIWEDAAGEQVYGFPAVDGPAGGVKTAFFRRGAECTPETIERRVAPAETAVIARHLATRLPDVPGAPLRAAACMYTNTPDEHFVIARHPRHSQVTVACGFSGHGFKFVPVVGEILADLATTGRTDHPIALFDPRRSRTEPTRTR